MPKRRHSVASQHEPVPGQTDVPLDTLMNQSCSICLENFWDPACIIACPADVCSALMCSHCAIKQHGMGVRRNGARTTEVHTCFSCRNDRHQAGPNGAPVSDPTPPRQGIHIRALASNGGISKWRCGFHKYWPIGTECSRIFDSYEAIGRHAKWGCGDFHAKCPHNGCDQRGQVKWLFAEHIPSCENQFNSAEPCGDCGVFLDARDEQGLHGYVCKERVARCPMCEAYFSKRCTMPGHFDASQESGGLLDDNDHVCDIHVVNMIYSRSGVCWSNLVAMASIQISIKQSGDKVWRVKNNAYDILVVVSPERDGVTRVVPFIYQFEDIHTARAKDIPRYRLKVVITGVGSGRSDTFSLQAHRFMTGEQPTWSSKDLYPLVTWTEDERRGSLGVRDVMFSVEMHGDTTIAKRSAFCQQEDPSMSSQTPPTPLYVPPLSGSASPDIA